MSLVTFTKNAVADYASTAAILPSSQQLAREMVRPLRCQDLKTVIEFGPGTGVITRELLRQMPVDATLLAFEISEGFVSYLRETIRDERLQIVRARAETATEELRLRGISSADAVVSSLGICLMGQASADAIFPPLLPFLGGTGTLTQYQYLSRIRVHAGRVEYFSVRRYMTRHFHSVSTRFVWLNLPPAHVISCRGARAGDQLRPAAA